MSRIANNALLGGGVRVRVWIREQRKIKGTTKPLLAILDISRRRRGGGESIYRKGEGIQWKRKKEEGRERTKESREVEGEVIKREERDHVYIIQEHSHLPEPKSRLS